MSEAAAASSGGGSALPYILAIVALAVGIGYQFFYVPSLTK